MRFLALMAGVSLAALVSSAAYAADLIVEDSAAPMVMDSSGHDWSGFYAGLFAGYGSGTGDWTGDYSGNGVGTDASGDFGMAGWLLGVDVGANAQFDSFVLGVEGDLAWANITGEGDAIDPLSAFPSIPSASLDWLGTLRGRAGVALDSVLLYGTGGLAFGGGNVTITNVTGGGDDRTEAATYMGWAAGVGAEFAVADNVSIKAEYLYADLSTDTLDFGATPSGDLTVDGHLGIHTVKVGVNVGF